ncbi:MAG: RNase adapter RapZ [Myxococcota bacterium]
MRELRTRIVFVSGLSGSGRSTAMAGLEDASFYCVDNLPPQLVVQFVDLCRKATPPIRKIALAVDTREEGFLRGLPDVVRELRQGGARVEVIFLDCAQEALVDRYRETRRVHPLSPSGTVEEGVARERKALTEIASLADVTIDTTRLNVHELRDAIVRHAVGEPRPTVVNLVSFGFRYGPPHSADLLFDVRFLPNPHFEPELRPRTGEDARVSEYVLKNDRAQALLTRLRDWMEFLLPLYDAEGKAYLTLGVGCTGGRHRSVAVSCSLAEALRGSGREVNLSHRDMEKGP